MKIKSPKKLIEVALPLDAISAGCEQEKNPFLKGHPRAMHLWWARRPLAAARAVIFSQMVNDPGYERSLGRGVNKEKASIERERLFNLIEELVQWKNINNEEVLGRARAEILKSWQETCDLNKNHPDAKSIFNPEILPSFHDPFAGGGAIPLEAQRLGMESYASDLNPVAVTINKAMIEIPPRFKGMKPIGPVAESKKQINFLDDWSSTRGLAEDVRRYGAWIRDRAEERLIKLYPKVVVSDEMAKNRPELKQLVGQSFNVISWLWARTVSSPNPAFSHAQVPLVSTFILSTKKGKEAYVQPVVSGDEFEFTVKLGEPDEAAKEGTKLSRGANFKCILSN
jgi:putative DNA methylase